ncbi:MAG: hypothetical protein FXF49_04740 [Flexistipes sinusarabici]|uniref:Tetratricopeptide repeat protein n=1 Tax=Flexistipes sinusarabici TaxID=2352 RepID=A0A5D0ML37_FLESI|nr:tetratricopeptide repeat protein [Flexistipes sinusarabici]TYB33716.1 MAG: hypothetical protein FXF49_04740 [Flexistipes sinusarabici]
MKKTGVLVLSIFLLYSGLLHAEVKVPDFSFFGKEISSFRIKPTFTKINVSFKDARSFSTYIESLQIEAESFDRKEYSTKKPGSVYGGTFGTGLSAVFVGNKAYRNYIVKQFLEGNYFGVVNAYPEYKDKFTGGKFANETAFLYAFSLLKTGGISKAVEIFEKVAAGEDKFAYYAQDKLFGYFEEIGRYKDILRLGGHLKRLSPYASYLYLDILYKNNQYDKILNFISNYEEYVSEYQVIRDYKIAAEYFAGRLERVAGYEPFSGVSVYFITDALLKTGNLERAFILINGMNNNNAYKYYFNVKYHILKGDYEKAGKNYQRVENERDKLSLLFFYLSESFPDTREDVLNIFSFSDPVNRDYLNYYKGLLYLSKNKYVEAAEYFEQVVFQENLLINSYFYKGICYADVNASRSKHFFIRYLNNGDDNEKKNIARFMLGQFYYMEKQYEQTLMLVESCSTDFCSELKAQVYLAESEFRKALNTLNNIDTNKAVYLKAAALFNMKDYEKALAMLNKINDAYPGKDLLKMLVYYKLEEIDKGMEIFNQHNNEKEFIDRTIRQLYLANEYHTVINILNNTGNLTPEYRLIMAKSLYSTGRYDRAEQIYYDFLKQKKYLYDSINGLISIQGMQKTQKSFLIKGFKWLNDMEFEKENVIALDFARLAFNSDDTGMGIKYLNYFFNNYPDAPNVKEAYILRADFFFSKGKLKECIMDMNSAISRFGRDGELLLQKAKCMEKSTPLKALEIYRELSDSKRFERVAKTNIMEHSDNVSEVENIALEFKKEQYDLYLNGIERVLNITPLNKLDKKEDYAYELIDSGIRKYAPAGAYFVGAVEYAKGNYEKAASGLMKVYYLYPGSDYALKSLRLAKKAFIETGDNKNADKVQKIIDKMGNKEE